jgi:hypothetical protein
MSGSFTEVIGGPIVALFAITQLLPPLYEIMIVMVAPDAGQSSLLIRRITHRRFPGIAADGDSVAPF